jgi:hypothetical protein
MSRRIGCVEGAGVEKPCFKGDLLRGEGEKAIFPGRFRELSRGKF